MERLAEADRLNRFGDALCESPFILNTPWLLYENSGYYAHGVLPQNLLKKPLQVTLLLIRGS